MENKVSVILEGLNEEQRRAVQAVDGPVLIVAGAGSGKTRVLTSRVAYILDRGVDPSSILALTFTKKAAGEMKERIALMVGYQKARGVVMGTFHSVFIRFLREYAEFLKYPSQFTIYDTSDSTAAIKTCIKELGLDDKVYKPREVLARISNAKNNLVTAGAYQSRQDLIQADSRAKKPRICDLYTLYQQKLRESGVMDFDDILVNMNILLRDNPEALDNLSHRFRYILVDEYQDTNFSQYVILKKLSSSYRNICVVGDDSQSIYAFRGAKIENIINFRKDYPDSRIFRLECNYRSTQTIVDAANSVIAHNSNRIPKECRSMGDTGSKIQIIGSDSAESEAALVVMGITDRMRTEHAQYRDFAILYRTNNQSRALEEALRRRNIPYMIYSGNSFYERVEVKDMMAYMKLVVNPLDEESFKRIVNKPARGIGETSLEALLKAAQAHKTSLFKAAYLDDLDRFGLKGAAIQRIKAFCDMINRYAVQAVRGDAYEIAYALANESGYLPSLKADTSMEGMARTANVEELLDSVQTYVVERLNEAEENGDEVALTTLGDYLENVSLLSNIDTEEDEDTNKVALMTVHSSKGLEFPYVVITGLEENLFPAGSMGLSPGDIEEERRLFYVALTRAEKEVSLAYSSSRMRNGKTEYNPVSRFISEIDRKYILNPIEPQGPTAGTTRVFGSTTRPFGNYGQSSSVRYEKRVPAPSPRPAVGPAPSPAPAPTRAPQVMYQNFVAVHMTELYEGERIEHNRFGPGRILSITGVVPELKAEVEFDNFGKKTLLLKYAQMRPEKK